MPLNAPMTALVTGGAKRVGRAMCLHLAARGYAIGVHYNTSPDEASQLVEEILSQGGKAKALQADLADLDAVGGLVDRAADELGPLSLLINNASLFDLDTIESLDRRSWDLHMEINLAAPLFLSQAFAKALPEDGAGNIINIIDQRVWKLTPNFMSYTVSKTGLWTLTRTLAQALAPRIRVNAIGPGPTLKSTHQSDEDFHRQQLSVPLKRGPTLDEICAAVSFFLESPSVTGQMIAMDGGQHLSWETPDVVEAQNQRRQRSSDQ